MATPGDTPPPSDASLSDASPDDAFPGLQAVAEALSGCVREALERNERAEVPGMGAFRVEHQPSQMNEQGEGRFSVTPPRDAVVFEPTTP